MIGFLLKSRSLQIPLRNTRARPETAILCILMLRSPLVTRYHRVIASGTQTTALLLGLTAAHFSKDASMVGLEYWVKFRRPVFPDETIRLEWLVIKVTGNARLGGHIVDLRGRIRGQDGQTAVGAKGRILVSDTL